MNIYVIYDLLGSSPVGLPFFQPNHACARRATQAQFRDAPFDLSSYECRFIGTYHPLFSSVDGVHHVPDFVYETLFNLSELLSPPAAASPDQAAADSKR